MGLVVPDRPGHGGRRPGPVKERLNPLPVVIAAALVAAALLAAGLIAAPLLADDPPELIRRPTGRYSPALATATPTATPATTATATPTPDPCDACPDPESFSCLMWPNICFQCWEDCGSPIATHTPTPPPTPTKTPTPPPTPTPHGPACELELPVGGTVYLVAFYEHESSTSGTRYHYQTAPVAVDPGSTIRPCPCQGSPVGFKWYAAGGTLLKSCGDTSTAHWHIFSDGFETGNTGRWSQTVAPTPGG